MGSLRSKMGRGQKNTLTAGNVSVKPEVKKVPSENNSEIEKLLKTLISRVDNLEKTLSKIEKDIDELKNEWYGK